MDPILVIQQDPRLPGTGRLGKRIDAAGLACVEKRAYAGELARIRARDFAALIPLGGTQHAYDEVTDPWFADVRALLADAVDGGVPVLGICLGGQVLARALGGETVQAEEPEIGWLPIEPTPAAASDPVFATLPAPRRVYQWHHDRIEPPPGAVVLARSAHSPVQAYRAGDAAWGIQFHPEADLPLFREWLECNPDAPQQKGADVPAMLRDIEADDEGNQFASDVLDAFISFARERANGVSRRTTERAQSY